MEHLMNFAKLSALFLVVALVACGGGGSSTAPTSDNGGTTGGGTAGGTTGGTAGGSGGTTAEPNAVVSVPAPVYSQAVYADAFNRLNQVRAAAGIGLVAQHAYVDAAAQAHSNYLAVNDLTGHYETNTKTGWTGNTPADRIQAAGYGANSPWEVIAYANTTGADFVDMLVAAPYHRAGMLAYKAVHAGIGYAKYATISGYNLNIDITSNATSFQGAPNTPAAIWPADGATDTLTRMTVESPNPIPENNGAPAGYPVSVRVHEDKTLTVDSFTVTTADGTPVSVKVLSYATDPNLVSLGFKFFAAAVPTAPLAAGTTYRASFAGKINGTAYSKTWSFTTKAAL
jgi:uncharacterized protein YkwD